jgi:chromosome segregation ATPase
MSWFSRKKEEPPPAEVAPAASPTSPPKAPKPPVVANGDNMKITVQDEPEIDPERTNLEREVQQRDASVSALERARQEKQQQLTALEKELEKERLTQMTEALVHKIESERIKRQTVHAEDRLQALEQDMQDKAAINEYANLIKGVAPKGGVDSQYVMKLQAQLQKAVKKMETTSGQMKELEDESQQVVDGLTADITQLIQERCRAELELRKQMEVLDEEKREMQLEYEERIRENLKTLQALRAKAVNQTTIEELDEELQETESKLEELSRIQEKQAKSIEQLNKSLASQGDM